MNLTSQINTLWKAVIIGFFSIFLSLNAPMFAAVAQGGGNNTTSGSATAENTTITNILCNANNQLTGPIGRAISILIIISLAISLFLGKVSWGMAIAVAVGMGILFGARDVVQLLSGGEKMCV